MAKSKRSNRVVLVEWDDTSSNAKWTDREEAMKREPLRCLTIGLLIVDEAEKVSVAASLCDETNSFADVTIIPRGTIHKVSTIGMLQGKRKR